MTFLNHRSFYSISSLVQGNAKIFFTRSGANDPNFNMRHEPAMIIRKNGQGQSFITVTEIHGNFDPISEFTTNAYSSVKNIRVLQQDQDLAVVEIILDNKKLVLARHNQNADEKATHSAAGFTWTGPAGVFYDGKKIN